MVGVARQLFVPLSLAVAFSMVASYLLSSSLVPVFSAWLMRESQRGEEHERVFGRLRSTYERYLTAVLRFRWPLVLGYLVLSNALLFVLLPSVGSELFPDANAALLRLRLRAPAGTRIEETERIVLRALDAIGQAAGRGNVEISSDFIGLVPSSYPVDLIHLFTSGPQEAIIQVALKPDTPRGEGLREKIREELRRQLPECHVSFEAADIVSQVMSFGSPTPIEIAVQGPSLADDYGYAQRIQSELAKLSFLRDLQFAQEYNYPTLDININRERAGQFGLTMADVVHSIVPATSSSRFIEPNYWRDPNSGNAFQIQVQLPRNRVQSVEAIGSLPVMPDGRTEMQLDNIASLKQGTMPGLIERLNGQHIISLTANLHGIALGDAVQKQTSSGLRTGLLLAVVAIFLLLAANFQSVRLSLAIVLTVPAVLCGVLLMLRITGTTLNIQSFVGAIMAIGIAVANSILLVTFTERTRRENETLLAAVREGAASRLRAILMTATAMIAGMLPMAIGFGAGGSQAAPLGRAVIGGLLVATFASLTILPSIYAILQGSASLASPSLNPLDPASRYYEAR
jgi:multidrug efflux pump subunit AcrB